VDGCWLESQRTCFGVGGCIKPNDSRRVPDADRGVNYFAAETAAETTAEMIEVRFVLVALCDRLPTVRVELVMLFTALYCESESWESRRVQQ
jgi:hypothetical protein